MKTHTERELDHLRAAQRGPQLAAKPEPTREQEGAADAFALVYGRCCAELVERGGGWLYRVVALADDVEIGSTLTYYDEDGRAVRPSEV